MLNGTRYLARQFQGALVQKRRYAESECQRPFQIAIVRFRASGSVFAPARRRWSAQRLG